MKPHQEHHLCNEVARTIGMLEGIRYSVHATHNPDGCSAQLRDLVSRMQTLCHEIAAALGLPELEEGHREHG